MTKNTLVTTRVDLLRHGEPMGGSKYRGQTDDPLSPNGWAQMRAAVEKHRVAWTLVVSSPLSRCLEFAMELNQKYNLPLRIEDRFMEMAFGFWEGKTKAQIGPEALAQFYDNPVEHSPSGGENVADFYQRIIKAWDELINRFAGGQILIITHAGVIRGLLAHIEGLKFREMVRLSIPFAGFARIEVNHSTPFIEQNILLRPDK